jgi:hypothetical protein
VEITEIVMGKWSEMKKLLTRIKEKCYYKNKVRNLRTLVVCLSSSIKASCMAASKFEFIFLPLKIIKKYIYEESNLSP